MNSKRKKISIVIASVVGIVVVATLVAWLLATINKPGESPADDGNGASQQVIEPTPLPPTNAEAEALKAEAQAAFAAQNYDEALAKYEAAKAIYDGVADGEMYSSDIQVQLDIIKQQKEFFAGNTAPSGSGEGLAGSDGDAETFTPGTE